MKKTTFLLVLFILSLIIEKVNAQVSFKTEYISSSSYRDNNNNKVSGAKGSAMVYSGDIKIPLSVKTSKDSIPIIWAVDLSGAYASLNNKNLTDDQVLSNIVNLQFSLFNLRPLNKKWSLLTFAGAGIYTDQTQISKMNARSILGNVGALFIKKINPNLDLGAGVAFNNAFGVPMIFPALYVNYNLESNFTFKVSMLSGVEASAGYNFSDTFLLSLVFQLNGQLALLQKDGKDVMFTHQYFVTGFRPEIKITKNISLPITAGINAMRPVYYNDRSLKSIFDDKNTNAHFDFSPYVSAEINFKF